MSAAIEELRNCKTVEEIEEKRRAQEAKAKVTLGRLMCHGGEWTEVKNPDISQSESIQYGLLYHSSKGGGFMQLDRSGTKWITINESQAKRHLKHVSEITDKEAISATVCGIITAQNVDLVGPLAGYPTGVYGCGPNERILVTNTPKFIRPVPGNCATILKLLQEQFGETQLPYFLGWLKVAVSSVTTHRYVPGQAAVFAGVAGAGKTLIQTMIVTPLLGGRSARPYQYMCGQSTFNADLCQAEHLMISDEIGKTDLESRTEFGAKLKDICVNHEQKLHGKHKDGYTVRPYWRLTISLNNDEQYMKILPPLDVSVEDKLMLFKLEMPDCLPKEEEREAFAAAIAAELPAFAFYLETFVIPTEIKSNRYGVIHYHHPELVDLMTQLEREGELLELIDMYFDGRPFEGTATDLYSLLVSSGSVVNRRVESLVRSGTACGRLLAKLRRPGTRVQSTASKGKTYWHIAPLADDNME
jgi:hypothetical protein